MVKYIAHFVHRQEYLINISTVMPRFINTSVSKQFANKSIGNILLFANSASGDKHDHAIFPHKYKCRCLPPIPKQVYKLRYC